MQVSKTIPRTTYPYLATWTGKGEILDPKLIHNVKLEDIVLISMVTVEDQEDHQAYIQFVIGNRQGYLTKNEDEYCPLPTGYSITLTQ